MHNALGRVGFASSGVALKAKGMGEDPGTRPLKRRNSCSSGERATYRSIARDAQQRRGRNCAKGFASQQGSRPEYHRPIWLRTPDETFRRSRMFRLLLPCSR
jgi:hypothetical protein